MINPCVKLKESSGRSSRCRPYVPASSALFLNPPRPSRSDLQIYAVTPIPESQDVLQRDGVPDNIKSFYKFNHIWRFRYDRPFHKGTKDKENEFKVGRRKKVGGVWGSVTKEMKEKKIDNMTTLQIC